MQYIEEQTGLDSTKQIAIGALTIGLMYLGRKVIKNHIPTQKSLSIHKNVIIIGASRGIGLSLAREFLKYGDNVIIASSAQTSIERAYNSLMSELDLTSTSQILSYIKCDVTKSKDLQRLYQFARKTFAHHNIDIIINNFGFSGKKRDFLWNISSEEMQKIVSINLGGTLLSNKLSIESFIKSKQLRTMHIFNMSGAGTYGHNTPRMVPYGATKGGFINIMNSINKELKLAKLNQKIFIHSLSPGMVWTNLFAKKQNIDNDEPVISDINQYWILNALIEDVDVMTMWMVPKIRGVSTMKYPKGLYEINFLTKTNAIARIFGGAFFGYNKNRFMNKNGIAMQQTK